MDCLTKAKRGLTPEDIYDQLESSWRQGPEGPAIETLKTHIRSALKDMYDQRITQRKPARGPKRGHTFEYTLPGNSPMDNPSTANSPSLRPSPATGTRPRGHLTQCSDGAPIDLSPSLWRPSEQDQILLPDAGAQEPSGSNVAFQDFSHSAPQVQRSAGPVPAPVIGSNSALHLPRSPEHIGSRPQEENSVSDIELLSTARALAARHDEAMKEALTLESQRQKQQSQLVALETKVQEQESKKAELLMEAERLRQKASEAEDQAQDCQRSAEGLSKEAEGKSKDHEESAAKTVVAKEEVAEIAAQLQRTMVELKVWVGPLPS
jgi:hypothetical protein